MSKITKSLKEELIKAKEQAAALQASASEFPPDYTPSANEAPAIGFLFPKAAKAWARQYNDLGFRIIRRFPGSIGSACANCLGLGIIIFQALRGPFAFVPEGRKPHTYLDGAFWQIEEESSFPCPVCSSELDEVKTLQIGSGLLPIQYNWTIDHIKGKTGKERAWKIANEILAQESTPAGLYLFYGDYGMGKTGILVSLTAQLLLAGCRAHYVRAGDVLTKIRASYGDDRHATEEEILTLYGSFQFLAIDEVDVISDTSWAGTTIRLLLDARYNRRHTLATVMATNKDPDQLWPYLADRCLDAVRIRVSGEKLRGQK